MIIFAIQPSGFSLIHFKHIPVCERVNGINTPTAYKGMRCSVCPLNSTISTIDAIPRKMIPFEYPKRSPLTVNILGIYLSRAKLNASRGKAENPVFAASTKIIEVVP